ncbi:MULTISPECIES: threonine ammonia-lyase, biosynthetic [unclassified Oceanobacter]|uniref:threonine ammonia-lyase, biosynthetic n=1 Tax=unclassified Oceanobacter TaxID=2620260 RepID=UPI0026E15310|nr:MULTISPECIES: threonine ammonia-lyase, biosynthetic [unclassified Oceanobacter]MDO6680942.1 threonine ammonia-lyase, biosynthetic [Oceanobacter sp. 5_MG-2023]MDP2504703.1 threonine ammonia-lyase, biosynthetic [Oceanobacter sp. 3_MG-2023]
MLNEYLKKILTSRVYDVATETALHIAPFLSERLGNQIWIKREDQQDVYSFKIRGAYNKAAQLTAQEKARGVVTASAGNHAQGLALAASKLGLKAVIVMPRTTPEIKVRSVKARGAKVVLHGDAFDDAFAYSQKLVAEKGMTYIHPYDDPEVIAGQGTIGMEILRQMPQPIDAIFVPVGGGGLVAGVAAYIKALRPEIRVVGVESTESASLAAALAAGERVTLPSVGIFADGVAVATVGEHTWAIAKDCVDEVITCTPDEICAAIKDVFDDTRAVCEPAGALAIAGVKKYVEREGCENQNLVTVLSGANVNFDRLRYISEVAEIGEGREIILAVSIAEQPGSFQRFCALLGKRPITEFNYRYGDDDMARIYVGVKVGPEPGARDALLAELRADNYPVLDLTDDEMAKYHIRHMVGGHAPASVQDERLYRFEFPERPGALLLFLKTLGKRFNISLFHYRNHGAASARTLVGLQVPAEKLAQLHGYLDELGYPYWDESDNMAYQLFLR